MKGVNKVKRFLPFILIIILLFGYIDFKYTQNKHKDVAYVVERHLTTGFFNKYKLSSIDTLQIAFSDSQMAVVTISGSLKSTPNKKATYKVLAERGRSGSWRVKKVYRNS